MTTDKNTGDVKKKAQRGQEDITWIEPDDPRIPAAMRAEFEDLTATPGQLLPAQPFDPAALEEMRKDPQLAAKLELLQEQADKDFIALIEKIFAELPKEEAGPSTAQVGGPAVSGRQLRADSRRGELSGKARRELAEAMAVEIVLNLGNGQWNPLDPETSRETPSALLALLR